MKKQYFAPVSVNVTLDPKLAMMQSEEYSINGGVDDTLFED